MIWYKKRQILRILRIFFEHLYFHSKFHRDLANLGDWIYHILNKDKENIQNTLAGVNCILLVFIKLCLWGFFYVACQLLRRTFAMNTYWMLKIQAWNLFFLMDLIIETINETVQSPVNFFDWNIIIFLIILFLTRQRDFPWKPCEKVEQGTTNMQR